MEAPTIRTRILAAIGNGISYSHIDKIRANLDEDDKKAFCQAIYNIRVGGFVERKEGTTKEYRLTDLGRKELMRPTPPGMKPNRKSTIVEPEKDSFNLSSSAELLQNNVAMVLTENQQLRNLLNELHSTIGKALQL